MHNDMHDGQVHVRLTDYVDENVGWIVERLNNCDMITAPRGYGFRSALSRAVRIGVVEKCVAPDGTEAWRRARG